MKQYFEKIKQAETGPEQPTVTLNKAAAGRVIRHALAGNGDLQRAEREARERARLKRKVHTRFGEEEEGVVVVEAKEKKRKVESEEGEVEENSNSSCSSEDGDREVVEVEEGEMQVESRDAPKKTCSRKQRELKRARRAAVAASLGEKVEEAEMNEGLTKKKKRRQKRKKSGGTEVQDVSSSTPDQGQAGAKNGGGDGKGKSKWVKKAIARKRHEAAAAVAVEAGM